MSARKLGFIVSTSVFLVASMAVLYSQTKPAPNTPAGFGPNNLPFYWHPPHTNHVRYTNVWTTIAGLATIAGSHDGASKEARFNQPVGIAMGKDGDLFVADALNHTIRLLSTNGAKWTVKTIAGSPGRSGSADGTNDVARFNEPTGIAVDGTGNLFVADTLNNTIRKISPVGMDWVVTTIAGLAGTNGFRDGTNQVARFNRPLGIAAGGGGVLFVADTFNHTIREITPVDTNWVVKTIAGSPLSPGRNDGVRWGARFNQPAGITLDRAGNLYVADEMNCTIRKLRLAGTNWVVSPIAGAAGMRGANDGAFVWARFGTPCAISADSQDHLYVTDSSNQNIRKMTPSETNWIVSTLAGWAGYSGTNDGTGMYARFDCPCGIAVNTKGNRYYVADSLNDTIRAGGGSIMQTNITLGEWKQPGRGIPFNEHAFIMQNGKVVKVIR